MRKERIIKKKICMLGTFAVGKTSLVRRFTSGIFSEKYLTTMGARVEKKTTSVQNTTIELLVWDLNGEDRFQELHMDYVQGAAGYLLVFDQSRRSSLEAAHSLHQKVQMTIGQVPFILVVNKADLQQPWEGQAEELEQLKQQGWVIHMTSAKTGMGVDEVFDSLAHMIMQP